MREVRDTGSDLHQMRIRLGLGLAFVLLMFGLLVARLVYLQVWRYEDFRSQAEDNRISLVPETPTRGLISDRNGNVLAENVSAFTLELAPAQISDLNATIEELASIITIDPRDRRRFQRLREDSRKLETIPLKVRLSDEEAAKIAVARYRLPGVEIRARQFRSYPMGGSAAHLLGHIGRVSAKDLERIEQADDASNYAGATHIGKTGVELSYENQLRGIPGVARVEVSAGGRVVRTLSRTPPKPGDNLVLSIDIHLQKLLEDLYGDRKGALVAIEPATGEVLAFVSRPTFDPNSFVDGIDYASWNALNDDPDKPLMNRPLRGTYPPGSTYKPFMALAALTSGTRTPEFTIQDPGYFMVGKHRFRDSRPEGNGTVNLHKSIVVSSDTYYYRVAYEMGPDAIHDFMVPWGFGQITGIDLDNETTGLLPSSAWKMKRLKKKWYPGESPSIGIGQGFNAFTILQLSHATATLANGGLAIRPHVVRAIIDPLSRKQVAMAPPTSHQIEINPRYLELVKSAMIDVSREGTSRIAFAGVEYAVASKTGTAQVIGMKQNEKYNASRIAERFRDHSLFIAFAPADKPRIAIALIVENGGFGAQAAAPIARAAFDFYLLGKLPRDFDTRGLPGMDDDSALRDIPTDLEPGEVPLAGEREGQ
ncbi:MAG: penicillin-binding protein 2 [Burkholderiaceae bacterium]|nr:penicillin-binding protein 2 [Burkholderiaceae bacterium]